MTNKDDIIFEEGADNIFADLGLDESDELYTRAQIGFHVLTLLKNKNLKQKDAALLLGIAQPDVSHLMNGHFSRFTADKLLDFLRRLDQTVSITIRPHKQGEPYSQIAYGA